MEWATAIFLRAFEMARMAGSKLSFSDINLTDLPYGAGAAAGGGAKMGQAFKAARENTGFRPDEITSTNVGLRGQLKAGAIDAANDVRVRNTLNEAAIEAAEIQSKAEEDAARSAGNSAMGMGAFKGALGLALPLIASDETIKNNINPLDDALLKLRELKPITFYYNEEYSTSPERLHHGFIAQEYQKVLPDATYYDESTGKLCIDPGDVISILVRAVQQLEVRLMHMEACHALAGVK
jgi:hypothetical protein